MVTKLNNGNYCKQICTIIEDLDNAALHNLNLSEEAPNDDERKFFVSDSIDKNKQIKKLQLMADNNNCGCVQ